MSDALPYTRGNSIPRRLAVSHFFKNYFAMYKSLMSPLTRGTRIPRLLGVRNYLKNYFALYKRLAHSRIRVELPFPAYLGLGII